MSSVAAAVSAAAGARHHKEEEAYHQHCVGVIQDFELSAATTDQKHEFASCSKYLSGANVDTLPDPTGFAIVGIILFLIWLVFKLRMRKPKDQV